MLQSSNLEDEMITKLMNDKTAVAVYLRHGIKLTGTLSGYDKTTVLLKGVGEQMVFKDAISTIVPLS